MKRARLLRERCAAWINLERIACRSSCRALIARTWSAWGPRGGGATQFRLASQARSEGATVAIADAPAA